MFQRNLSTLTRGSKLSTTKSRLKRSTPSTLFLCINTVIHRVNRRMNHVLKHAEVNDIAYEPARPQHQSTDVVKGLLYNIPERYAEYNQTGRKPGPAKMKHGAPFAQSENLVEADYPSSFHLQKHNTQVNDKVGHGQFDPEVYRANAMANINNRTQSRNRNFIGSGNILSYNNK